MVRIKRTTSELKEEMREQIELLMSACERYDGGSPIHGKEIAIRLRVLLHHHGRSNSLLQQLQLRRGRFLDRAGKFNPNNFAGTHNLTSVKITVDGDNTISCYEPKCKSGLGEKSNWMPFPDWWKEVVIRDGNGVKFSRSDIVLHLADTDGGAHVDPSIEEQYKSLSRGNSLGIYFGRNGEILGAPVRPELASARQIAYELLCTLGKRGVI